ncbi:MAG: hypothetical protein ACD_7C00318G0001 [uncultured bacterium]|nr:MAG: hypothetical protein ACD_7C00318G0001 [uncultured bacterium]HBR79863.1 hypothetical protein [Candidatus Moranbacteria bacterium]
MNDRADKILKNIEAKKIKPAPKWKFLLKDYLVWSLFGLSTFVGALATGVIIFICNDNDWDIYNYLGKSFWSYGLILIPYFWIIILALLGSLAYFNYQHTRRGYLLNPYLVIAGSILASIFLGWLLFSSGISERMDKFFAGNIPYYQGMEANKQIFWSNPEKGLLSGEIDKIKNRDNFTLRDFRGKQWEIIGNNIIWKEGADMRMNERVKIIGKIGKEKNVFRAKEVRPWGCGCRFCGGKQKYQHESCDIDTNNGNFRGENATCNTK